jgi:primosomal protein N' (replication factor Y)
MVAKGLHVPGVTLVGVVLADIGLNIPDLRAGERAFQLLCQVAGRAGRGTSPGRAIIQTYIPDNYAVQAAAGQDYDTFYSQEIEFRHQYANPPFNRLVHMTYLHTNDGACRREAEKMGRTLRQRAYSLGLTDLEVVGPAPAFPERVRGRYRWHLILRGRNIHQFLEGINIPHDWTVDVDPVSVL